MWVSGFRLLRKFFHLLAVHCHLGHEPIAQGRAHDPEVLDDEISSHGPPLELLAAAKARELVLVTAQQEKAAEFPAVRLDPDVLFADDGNIVTAAGSSAALDACLELIRRDHGAETAVAVSPAAPAA